MEASARVTQDAGKTARLRLEGQLSPLWLGNLASGLAEQRIGIVSAHGRIVGFDWSAELTLDFSGSVSPPAGVDYLRLAATSTNTAFTGGVKLSRFTCARLSNGMLEVSVFGPDQPAFLARLLARMVVALLFVSEFEIQTRGDQIEDRFTLMGMAGRSPSAEAQKGLENALRSFCS